MRVAVITPYCKEPIEKLKRCHDSVFNQTAKRDGNIITHFLIADGYPKPEISNWAGTVHITLPNHNDYGDTPRLVGSASATTMLYDAILFLDADNWFEANHIEKMMQIQKETQADVITCPRIIRRLDENPMGICFESDGKTFNDTNCCMIMQSCFAVCRAWGFKDPSLSIIGDRVLWQAILKSGCKIARSNAPTVNYETTFATHYRAFGETPPPGCKIILQTTDGRHIMASWEAFLEYAKKNNLTL